MAISRLAPSPTGAQHLGNARTYLLAYWAARQADAKIVLRLEDIDSPRVKPWAMQQAVDDLRWLGIEWDEGPTDDFTGSPYVQTNRTAAYADALDRLRQSNLVYPCVCTRKDIQLAASAPHSADGMTRYPGTCASWSQGDALPAAGSYCWRFRCPASIQRSFDDLVAGPQSSDVAARLGDFPITRKSGEFAYQLAVVVDDADMGVSEVVRGDDLIDSTFWQLELYAALGWAVPRFAHVPLVVGADGRRLAKRHGDTRLSYFRDQGVQASQVIQWAAESAGLAEPGSEVSHHQMIERFCWENVAKQRVIVDAQTFVS